MASEEYNPDWFTENTDTSAPSDEDYNPAWFADNTNPSPAAGMGEFRKGLYSGGNNLQAIVGGLGAAAGSAIKNEPLTKWGLDQYKKQSEEAAQYRGRVTDISEIQGPGDALDFFLFHGGSGIATTLPALAGGGVGGLAAKSAAKSYIEREVAAGLAAGIGEREAAQIAARKAIGAGATAGAYTGSAGLETGSIMGDIYEKTGELRPGTAAAFGSIAGAVEVLPVMVVLNKFGLGARAKKEITERAMDGLAAATGKQVALESGTEGIQTSIERLAVEWVDENQKAFTPEGWHEILNATAAGASGGAMLGAGSHVLSGGPLRGQKAKGREIPGPNENKAKLKAIIEARKKSVIQAAEAQAANAASEVAAQGGDALSQAIAVNKSRSQTDAAVISASGETVLEGSPGVAPDGRLLPPEGMYDDLAAIPESGTIQPLPTAAHPSIAARDPAPRDETGAIINRNEPARPKSKNKERNEGLDGLINAAVDMGFTDEAAKLITAKRLFRDAAIAEEAGRTEAADRLSAQASRLYQSVTVEPEMAELSNQFPVPYISGGEVVGGDIAVRPDQPNFTIMDEAVDSTSARIENLIEDQSTKNRLEDGNIIYQGRDSEPKDPDYPDVGQNVVDRMAQRPAMIGHNPIPSILPDSVRFDDEIDILQAESSLLGLEGRPTTSQEALNQDVASPAQDPDQDAIITADLAARKKKSEAAVNQSQVNTDKDSLIPAIIKLGGINEAHRADTITDGNVKGWAGRSLIMPEGRSLDEITTALDELGYIPKSEMEAGNGLRYVAEQLQSEFGGFGKKYAIGSKAETDSFEAAFEEERQAQEDRFNEAIEENNAAIAAELQSIEDAYGGIAELEISSKDQETLNEYYGQKDGGSATEEAVEGSTGIDQQAQEIPTPAAEEFSLSKEQDGVKPPVIDTKAAEDKAQINRERDHFSLDTGEGNVAGVGMTGDQAGMFDEKPTIRSRVEARQAEEKAAGKPLEDITLVNDNGVRQSAAAMAKEIDARLDGLYALKLCVEL